jgi:hypothetical protein
MWGGSVADGDGLTQRDIMIRVLSTVENIEGRVRGVELDVAAMRGLHDTVREHDVKIEQLERVANRRRGADDLTWKVIAIGVTMFSAVLLVPGAIIGLSALGIG